MSLIYRRTYARDRIKIKEMFENKRLPYDGREPLIGFVAEEEETGNLIGVSYAHKAIVIDPFVSTVPMSAVKLIYMTEGAINALDFTNIVVQVNSDNSSLMRELDHLGFQKVESKFAIYKKVV